MMNSVEECAYILCVLYISKSEHVASAHEEEHEEAHEEVYEEVSECNWLSGFLCVHFIRTFHSCISGANDLMQRDE